MRKYISLFASLIIISSLSLFAGTASAVSSLEFIWDATDSATITVNSVIDETIRGSIRATGDTAGMSGIFVSFAFDEDLKDELNIARAQEGIPILEPDEIPGCLNCTNGGTEQTVGLPGAGNAFAAGQPGYVRNQIESDGTQAGLLGSFDVTSGQGSGLTAGGTATSITRTLGSIWFTTNAANVENDGVDVNIVVLDDGFDAILASNGANISNSVLLSGGIVNSSGVVVPEPTAGLLLMAGIGGLVFAGRRNRR